MALCVHYRHRKNVPSDLIEPMDVDFQRILWQPKPKSPPQHYRLRTVTYGLAPVPYLAMRVLQQLAIDDGHLFPAAVPIIESSIYVDDTLFGRDSLQLRETRDQLIALDKRRRIPAAKMGSQRVESATTTFLPASTSLQTISSQTMRR